MTTTPNTKNIAVRYAERADGAAILRSDKHIASEELYRSISVNRVYAALYGKSFAGWLRYNLFWDNTPFLNMLFVIPPYRGKGCGGALLRFWESEMLSAGYDFAMTSTAAAESARFFYEKFGYVQCGGFYPARDGYELLYKKKLR